MRVVLTSLILLLSLVRPGVASSMDQLAARVMGIPASSEVKKPLASSRSVLRDPEYRKLILATFAGKLAARLGVTPPRSAIEDLARAGAIRTPRGGSSSLEFAHSLTELTNPDISSPPILDGRLDRPGIALSQNPELANRAQNSRPSSSNPGVDLANPRGSDEAFKP